jgi:uncharacterized protein with FMN-binding domain
MKKIFTSFVFIVLFAGYVAFEYLNNSTLSTAATQPVATTQTQVQTLPVTSTVTSAQSAPPPTQDSAQENASDGGSDDSSETPQQTQTQSATTQTTQPAQTTTQTGSTTPKPTGQYVDGTYTGSVANAFYGEVQVSASISGGKLTNVTFLQYPNDRRQSQMINQQAMPILINEAIQSQSANVNGVSGASDTSAAFQLSLSSALSQAKS